MLYHIETIKKERDGNFIAEIILNKRDEIFKGHFPGTPVLPGAAMVNMLRDIVETAENCKLQFGKGYNIKFVSVIVPEENQMLIFNIQTKILPGNELSVNATLLAGNVLSMKFSGIYKII